MASRDWTGARDGVYMGPEPQENRVLSNVEGKAHCSSPPTTAYYPINFCDFQRDNIDI